MKYQLLGKLMLTGKITCVTGLHIGGSTTGVEIGGLENPVIKDPLSDKPYIPGSALKGKLRSLTEWSLGLIELHSKHKNTYAAYECSELEDDCPEGDEKLIKRWKNARTLGQLFGSSSDSRDVRLCTGPSRLIVRDAFVDEDTLENWKTWMGAGVYTEVKTENALDRVTAEANPRPMERVPAGSSFEFTMFLDVYETLDFGLLDTLLGAMRLLEHSTLGGSGSRGSGQIRFDHLALVWRPITYYRTGQGEVTLSLPGSQLEEILPSFHGEALIPAGLGA